MSRGGHGPSVRHDMRTVVVGRLVRDRIQPKIRRYRLFPFDSRRPVDRSGPQLVAVGFQ
jgi:hypothetical protein